MKTLLRFGLSVILALAAVLFLFMATASVTSKTFAPYFPFLFLINIAVVVMLTIVVISLVSKLFTRFRHNIFGSRMLVRLVVTISIVTLVPALLVYLSSSRLLKEAFDSGVDARVEHALDSSLALSHAALDRLQSDQLLAARRIAHRLSNSTLVDMTAELARSQKQTSDSSLMILGAEGSVIAHTTNSEDAQTLPLSVSTHDITVAKNQGYFMSVDGDPLEDASGEPMAIRVIVPVTNHASADSLYVQVRQILAKPLATNISGIVQGLRDYQQIVVSRDGLQQLFGLTLIITLILVTLFAVLGAFVLSERWTAPIRQLADGTRRVADGHYQPIQEFTGADEINELTRDFNVMVREINDALSKLEARRDELEQSNIFRERILENISTGIIVLDNQMRIKSANFGAVKILGNAILQPNQTLDLAYPTLATAIMPILRESARHVQQKDISLTLDGKVDPLTLFVRTSTVPLNDGPGFLIVVDDMTQAVAAQRVIAWGEVARRMAHEIKNPLTPILLAAERMQIKLSKHLPEEDLVFLNRYTNTIVEQVSSIKHMVNDFRDYAKLPKPVLRSLDLNNLIDDVATLYRQADVHVTLDLDANLPMLKADRSQLLQVLHNLFSNAKEATPVGGRNDVTIRTHFIQDEASEIILCFEDNGPGFPPHILTHAFEPYITTKPTGTGLGLPMVKKIIDEHNGYVRLSNAEDTLKNQVKGAIVTIGFFL